MRWNRLSSAGCWAIVLIVLALSVSGALAGNQERPYRVAVLTPGLSFAPVLEGIRKGLTQLGYVEGENITLMVEDTHGMVPDLAERAARLVATKPDVLISVATTHTVAAKRATSSIPIVFTWVGEPLSAGLIASYASSKNNLTGIATFAGSLSGKRLELLQEIAPGSKRVLAVVAVQERIAQDTFALFSEVAQKLGVEVLRRDVVSIAEIEQVVHETPAGAVDAIFHIPSTLVGTHIELLIQKAKQEKIPLIVHEESLVAKGALASYGPDFRLIGMQTARLIPKILQGAQPSEVPVQTPDKLFLAVNLTTAQDIALTLPRCILERTDRMLE